MRNMMRKEIYQNAFKRNTCTVGAYSEMLKNLLFVSRYVRRIKQWRAHISTIK